jgi:SNF2 family DNA or RNA helicase
VRTSLCEKFAGSFESEERNAGNGLFNVRALSEYRASPTHVEAEIDGNPYCAVQIELVGRALQMTCECDTAQASQGCPHLWCALRAADEYGDLQKATSRAVRQHPEIAALGADPPAPSSPSSEVLSEEPPQSRPPTPPPASPPASDNGDLIYEYGEEEKDTRSYRTPRSGLGGLLAAREATGKQAAPASRGSDGQARTNRAAHSVSGTLPNKAASPQRGISGPLPLVRAPTEQVDLDTGLRILYLIPMDVCRKTGRLAICTFWQTRRGRRWGELRPLRYEPFGPTPGMADDHFFEMLAPFSISQANVELYGLANQGNLFAPGPETTSQLIPMLAETGRLFWQADSRDPDWKPLSAHLGDAWKFHLAFEVDDSRVRVTGSLMRNRDHCDLNQALFYDPGGIIITHAHVALLEHFGAFNQLLRLRYRNPLILSLADADVLVRQLLLTSELDLSSLPPELQYAPAETDVTGQLFVRTAQYTFRGKEQLHVDLSFDYGGVTVEEHSEETQLLLSEGHRLFQRDLSAEEAIRSRLRLLGFRLAENAAREEVGWKLDPSRLDDVVRVLLEDDWLVVAEGKTYRKPVEKRAEIRSGQDWFELKGDVTFGDQKLALPQLLALQRKGATTVVLDDGSIGVLPLEWLTQFTALTELGDFTDDALQFRRSQAVLIDSLIKDRNSVDFDAQFAAVRERLSDFSGVSPAPAPNGFGGTLRSYQAFGLGWIGALASMGVGGCLADDMGLGKTVQVLAFLLQRKVRGSVHPSLVVMPKSLIFNWQAEAETFAPTLRIQPHTGAGRARSSKRFRAVDVVLTTYGTLRMDIEWLSKVRFDCCILDESQAIKNADTSTAKAARLIDADFRLAMSGTPVENHIRELFSQFEFLNPGMLGRSGLATYLTRGGDLSTEDLEAIRQALHPYILRRTKGEVATELPEKTEQTIYCALSPEQETLYAELKDYYRQKLLDQKKQGTKNVGRHSKIDMLEALLRLRQAACHPGMINEKYLTIASGKLDLVVDRIEELREEGHKVLVFSQFTTFLKLVRDRLTSTGCGFCYLDGQTSDRDDQVRRFQECPEFPVFLISLKAGGVGLNLTAAEYVFMLDPWWNPATESQAIDRAHRIGQTRRVFAYRFISKGTVEEKVLSMQMEKREIADAVISANASAIANITPGDIELLLQ